MLFRPTKYVRCQIDVELLLRKMFKELDYTYIEIKYDYNTLSKISNCFYQNVCAASCWLCQHFSTIKFCSVIEKCLSNLFL